MAKSNLFVRCPKFKTECDIDTCPRFLSNIEVITGSDGNRTANGFCFERNMRYITDIPQKYFCDRQQTAAWEFMEHDARDEVAELDRIRQLYERMLHMEQCMLRRAQELGCQNCQSCAIAEDVEEAKQEKEL